jgi:hypothetical protein
MDVKNPSKESMSKSSQVDESSSSASYYTGHIISTQSRHEADAFDLLDDHLNFTDIPAMSNDGMVDELNDEEMEFQGASDLGRRNNDLQEGEEEEMVLDRAADYKMVSIMRQKRTIVADPYQISDANTLS